MSLRDIKGIYYWTLCWKSISEIRLTLMSTHSLSRVTTKTSLQANCEWVVKAIAMMNEPQNKTKWTAGFPLCGWRYIDKVYNSNVLERHQRYLLLDPVLEEYFGD